MKQFTTAIVGLGARGLGTYAPFSLKFPETMKIVAVADTDKSRVNSAREKFGIDKAMCFDSAEEFLKQPKLADLLILATQDRQHFSQAEKALLIGYDILLEKPVSTDLSECVRLKELAEASGRQVIVCHVLRYTMFYRVMKEILDNKRLGNIVSVQAIENVGYWHQAHSFVRGNWRDKESTSPMILQKCCHDFDIISWLIGKRCLKLSSFGSLKYFKKDNAPAGSEDYCVNAGECRKNCPYDAVKIYLDDAEMGFNNGNDGWPVNILSHKPDSESLNKALTSGPYGRCVFRCDNNVVDHQVVSMQYENEITASFTMSGFTPVISRQIKVMCEQGELDGDMYTNLITVTPFGKTPEITDINKLTSDLSGHSGGDNEMMRQTFEMLENGSGGSLSSIADSIHSHVIAFAAEESRLRGGECIDIARFEKTHSKKKRGRASFAAVL